MFSVMAVIYFFYRPDTGYGVHCRSLRCQRDAGRGVLSHVVYDLLLCLAGGGARDGVSAFLYVSHPEHDHRGESFGYLQRLAPASGGCYWSSVYPASEAHGGCGDEHVLCRQPAVEVGRGARLGFLARDDDNHITRLNVGDDLLHHSFILKHREMPWLSVP